MSVSGKYDINGYPIHYYIYGTGSHTILLIPGALGSPPIDFRPQLEGNNALDLNKYTIVGIDLPGWGRSRPPNRQYDENVFQLDLKCCLNVMDNLGHQTFSVIGWSVGARIAVLLGLRHPDRVKCVVSIGIFVNLTNECLMNILYTRNINLWPKEQLADLVQLYGDKKTVQQLYGQHIDFIKKLKDEFQQDRYDIPKESLESIKIPMLFIHGDKDTLIDKENSIYCKETIPGAILYRFPEGSHNSHQVFANKFKILVENFINESITEKF